MNIQPIQFQQPKQINFKSTYPVVHWVAETNGSYAPALSLEIVKVLQRKLVSILNKVPKAEKPVGLAEQKLKTYMKLCDLDFRKTPFVRSFYDWNSRREQGFKPVSYVISGEDAASFNEDLTKEIGRNKGIAKTALGNPYSAESMMAINNYVRNGLKFVNSPEKRITGKDGNTYVLHTKFEVIRNKNGKIKGYNFVDARFLPEKGPNNPIERYRQGG